MYTVGVKRQNWPGFRKFKVKGHRTETEIRYKSADGRDIIKDIKPRLVLTLKDDSTYVVPDIETKEWILFGDYKTATEGVKWPTDQKSDLK